ncbi:26S proteasome non-ATPase regulatory subunit 12 homolog A-like [Hibiscus syriacus]|uniref:26S proteasome non-ATPase regulatory subunit 12 homolog A-like n=1 Tax=Hibiscus syriacus TaxID=106335 RepID=UPI001924150A|nr:26S proteasome non-ATPase regulatory subunit 12 homolog A-like [Hibiscus syriacus]
MDVEEKKAPGGDVDEPLACWESRSFPLREKALELSRTFPIKERPNTIGIPKLPELKHIYYEQMHRFHSHNSSYLECCICYKAMYGVPLITEDGAMRKQILRKICWYIVLAPSNPVKSTFLRSTLETEDFTEIPNFKWHLQKFAGKDIIKWTSLWNLYRSDFEDDLLGGSLGEGDKAAQDLKIRVVEHNS